MKEASWDRWEAERRKQGKGVARVSDQAGASRIALFKKALAALAPGAPRRQQQQVIREWLVLTDHASRQALTDRAEWPAEMRRYVASLYGTTPDNWERVAAFLLGESP